MCGIAGFVGFRDDELIKQFSKWLEHRGPDGDGFYIDEDVTLLSRRLAIIDVKGGDQPIYNEDGSIVVVYNGEIYNYLELRSELEKAGHTFKTHSDTEVIVHGYEEWGDVCFDRFNGMFGIALYDIKRKRALLVRDHFGIKPLYFCSPASNQIIFSSEIKPLIYSGLIPAQSNDRIIYRYLKYRIHDDGRETFFKGVERLLPGELMIIENGKREIKKYTKLEEKLLRGVETRHASSLQEKDIFQFKSLLIDSIKRRLVSEVPVGTCLSGGLDSSTVVSVVNKLLKEKVGETKSVGDIQKTFSAVFPGSNNDEEKYIDEVIKLKVKSYKVKPNSDEFLKDLKDFIKTQEEPTISTGPYAQYKVMQEAHKYVTVVLDGQGADEMMAGYLPYYFVYLNQLWITKKHFRFFSEVFSSYDVILKYLVQKLFPGKKGNFSKLLNKEFNDANKGEIFKVNNTDIKARLIDDIFRNSLQSLLRYEDKNAMRFSIEGRVPFLDFRLTELLFSLPDEAIIKDGWNKFILREATKDLLPGLINNRRNKIGFTTPESEWFKKKSADILAFFTGEQFEAKKYVNQAEVVMAFKDYIAGRTDDTMLFWRILNLELWMREFIQILNPQIDKSTNQLKITNNNKSINPEITIHGKKYLRYPIRTDVFKKGDEVVNKIAEEVNKAFLSHPEFISGSDSKQMLKQVQHDKNNPKKFFIVISEKVVAVAQGRAHFIWDIHPSIFANILSRFVSRVPWGIGLGSPWTMELAIREVGLPRILLASIIGGIGKLVGVKGLFYRIAGRSAAGIDGPTEYSLYPANVSAKLLPKDPQKVCGKIDEEIATVDLRIGDLPRNDKGSYLGSAIIDANDIGRNVLGNTTSLSNKLIEDIFKDNPMGQTNEQTPVTIVLIK
ncbi:asparagine synthase (glutamine-hydrolyzing) [Candidatus Roizmanbacteria bacterium]|nr:asparagine synthase (glutamine-hydrolyzing) [Candidatus Roizmanbacteria bacterium]